MTKKNTIILIVILVIILVGGYVVLQKTGIFNRYPLSGTVSQCTSRLQTKIGNFNLTGKTVYQFTANNRFAQPAHFTEGGQLIPCTFNGKIPSGDCRLLLASLTACRVIYRSPNNWKGLPAIYEAGAGDAVNAIIRK